MKQLLIPFLIFVACLEAQDPVVIAHRGASAYAPENTLPSFELAWELGADAIEGDFHLTADGQIVCVHDYTIEKYTGVDKRVEDMTLAELRNYDFGVWKGDKWKRTEIPVLEEVLASVPEGKKVFVEIKCGPEIVPELLRQVASSGLEVEQVVFISFDDEVVKRLKKEAPQYLANWLVSIKRNDEGELEPSLRKLRRVLKRTKVDGISTKANEVVDSDFIASFAKKGYGYHVWTVDDPVYAQRLVEAGALSITTNEPDTILKAFGR